MEENSNIKEEHSEPPSKKQRLEEETPHTDIKPDTAESDKADFAEDVDPSGDNFMCNEDKYTDYVDPEEYEKLREFTVLDECHSNDEDSNDEDSESSDGKSEVPEEEIERMLEEGLPEDFKGAPKPKEKPYITRQKTVLEEKGVNQFEVLPLDWAMVRHYSGMPVYIHRASRVCTLSKPYFLGKGNTKRHDIPLSAIPCLAYRRALEEEAKQKEIDKQIEEQIKSGSWQRLAADQPAKPNYKTDKLSSANKSKCPYLQAKGIAQLSDEMPDDHEKLKANAKLSECTDNSNNADVKTQDVTTLDATTNDLLESGTSGVQIEACGEGKSKSHMDKILAKENGTRKENEEKINLECVTENEVEKNKITQNSNNDALVEPNLPDSNGVTEEKVDAVAMKKRSDKISTKSESVCKHESSKTEVMKTKPKKEGDNAKTKNAIELRNAIDNETGENSTESLTESQTALEVNSVVSYETVDFCSMTTEDSQEGITNTESNVVNNDIRNTNKTTDENNAITAGSEKTEKDTEANEISNNANTAENATNADKEQTQTVIENGDGKASNEKDNGASNVIDIGASNVDNVASNVEEGEPSIPLNRRPVVLPGGRVMPPPRVETVSTSWKTQHLTHDQVYDYCKKLFHFKTVNIMHFKRWADRRAYTKARKALQYPALPEGTKLITIPAAPAAPHDPAGGKASKRDWVMNMNGRSYLSVFHEYVRRALQQQPVYEFQQLENASTPYQATVYIGGMQYGVGRGSSKRAAKSAAARASIHILIPEMRAEADAPAAAPEPDFSFFDCVGIEDPRITEFCAATCEPSPHAILRTCLLRNFGAGDHHIHTEMKKLEYQKIELTMKVGRHSATVVCKNKKTAKQRASQAILQALHPHVRSWGSLLRLYGSRSVKSCKEKKLEEQQITLLQDAARRHRPNRAVLDKLRHEMRKLRARDAAVVPVGTLLLPAAPESGSSLTHVRL